MPQLNCAARGVTSGMRHAVSVDGSNQMEEVL